MRYIRSDGPEEGITAITERLRSELSAGRHVLWLVCGGSNIAAEAAIMQALPAELSENLTVTLTDERYGEPGHKDSNWQQLMEAGFDSKSAKALPVLNGKPLEQTIAEYSASAKELLDKSDFTLALFGIGADGHIAGILPDSPAARESAALAAGYDSPPYTRLTLTFPALERIDAAYAMAFGSSKRAALERLQNENLELAEQPSQLLKRLPEAFLFSDQIGGNS
ncbi:MAG TPA: 6-phosphogluconolactonase [Candidatus Saccharimonadales bacterium]|nr:6-phosphogluconolactonase [Candidatus Saccharimonadales bacterium]